MAVPDTLGHVQQRLVKRLIYRFEHSKRCPSTPLNFYVFCRGTKGAVNFGHGLVWVGSWWLNDGAMGGVGKVVAEMLLCEKKSENKRRWPFFCLCGSLTAPYALVTF